MQSRISIDSYTLVILFCGYLFWNTADCTSPIKCPDNKI